MKSICKSLSVIALLMLVQLVSNATVHRVNNVYPAGKFASFAEAHDAASAGDTIYVEGTSASYGDITVTKKLVIIGTGYFLSQNPQTQATTFSSTFSSVTFSSGSSYSVIQGFTITNSIYINSGYITVKSNYCGNAVSISASNTTIQQNYISAITGDASSVYNNIAIWNNIIGSHIHMNGNYSGVFSNNTYIYGGYTTAYALNLYNFTISNNIIKEAYIAPNNCPFYNNLHGRTDALLPTGNGNQLGVNMSNMFVGGTASTDGQYQLIETSPAINYGNDGTDCGAFGGIFPYVIGGIPQGIPSVYQITAPSYGSSTNGLNVTVKAKAH